MIAKKKVSLDDRHSGYVQLIQRGKVIIKRYYSSRPHRARMLKKWREKYGRIDSIVITPSERWSLTERTIKRRIALSEKKTQSGEHILSMAQHLKANPHA